MGLRLIDGLLLALVAAGDFLVFGSVINYLYLRLRKKGNAT
jgi:hypothetical protein